MKRTLVTITAHYSDDMIHLESYADGFQGYVETQSEAKIAGLHTEALALMSLLGSPGLVLSADTTPNHHGAYLHSQFLARPGPVVPYDQEVADLRALRNTVEHWNAGRPIISTDMDRVIQGAAVALRYIAELRAELDSKK